MKKVLLTIIIASILLLTTTAKADRGSIPYYPQAQVFEPAQRAMIAWNGETEILILSTDLYTSQPTSVLEVLPLPSEPSVKKGDVEVFRKANALINSKRRKFLTLGSETTKRFSRGMAPIPAGEVTFHEKIGAHDITVTHALKLEGFIEWVEDYLKNAGVDSPIIPQSIKNSVEEYIASGYAWFVFDVVSLDETPKTNDAIQYTFSSSALFYPLKISRTDQGATKIDLLVLTSKLLNHFPDLPVERINLRYDPTPITKAELEELSPDMVELLGDLNDIKLRIWELEGELSSFDQDIIAQRK